MAGNYSMKYCVDIAMCFDATGSMRPLLDKVKEHALHLYEDLMNAMNRKGKTVHEVRVRAIAFRDYLAVKYGDDIPCRVPEHGRLIAITRADG